MHIAPGVESHRHQCVDIFLLTTCVYTSSTRTQFCQNFANANRQHIGTNPLLSHTAHPALLVIRRVVAHVPAPFRSALMSAAKQTWTYNKKFASLATTQ